MLRLNELTNNPGSKKKSKRLGRGIGSGKGKTCGRGGKGQTARSGVAIKGFEGGQTPLIRRIPKRGFNSRRKQHIAIINLYKISQYIPEGSENLLIDKNFLFENNLISNKEIKVKVLAYTYEECDFNGIIFNLDSYSESARLNITKSGGNIQTIS
jgi:large subunit ribosomal protein L15